MEIILYIAGAFALIGLGMVIWSDIDARIKFRVNRRVDEALDERGIPRKRNRL